MNSQWILKIMTVLIIASVAMPSFACPVCYGESDSPMVQGVQQSVIFLAVFTYVVIVGGVAAFFMLRQKARRKALAKGAI